MLNLKSPYKIHYTLRFAAAMCFIGHGSFGIITKAVWCNYFAVFGVSNAMAYQLMPILGAFDIFCGLILLFYPLRIILLWLVGWGAVTALLRPLSGEPFAEFIERAGNFGAPLALLLLSGGIPTTIKDIFLPVSPETLVDDKTLARTITCLKIVVFLLLAGHGWLNLIEKKGLLGQYTMLGFSNPGNTAQIIGTLEIAAALTVLIKPLRPVVLVFLIWKITSELFYPHYEMFEWIERGGSYGAILALYFALGASAKASRSTQSLETA